MYTREHNYAKNYVIKEDANVDEGLERFWYFDEIFSLQNVLCKDRRRNIILDKHLREFLPVYPQVRMILHEPYTDHSRVVFPRDIATEAQGLPSNRVPQTHIRARARVRGLV